MSTFDVPGFKASNADQLHIGCWAEHDDGSLLLIEDISPSGEVLYSVIDRTGPAITERWGRMPEARFKREFSHGGLVGVPWLWHDKTPFPFDRATQPLRDVTPSAETAAMVTAQAVHRIGFALVDR